MSHLSLIIPVHNEAEHLDAVLSRIRDAWFPLEREWVIVDDGSTDGSAEILDRWVAEHGAEEAGMRVVHRAAQRGKGAAIAEGIKLATGAFIVVQDADAEYDPADIAVLLEPLLADQADVVFGSRFSREGRQVHRTAHYLVNRFLTALSNVLSGIYLSDMETCYKLFRADLLQAMDLRSDRFGVEVEMTAYVAKVRARVFELPISYFPRTRLAGKKIQAKDGVAALWHLVHFNLLVSRERAFTDLPDRYRA